MNRRWTNWQLPAASRYAAPARPKPQHVSSAGARARRCLDGPARPRDMFSGEPPGALARSYQVVNYPIFRHASSLDVRRTSLLQQVIYSLTVASCDKFSGVGAGWGERIRPERQLILCHDPNDLRSRQERFGLACLG